MLDFHGDDVPVVALQLRVQPLGNEGIRGGRTEGWRRPERPEPHGAAIDGNDFDSIKPRQSFDGWN